MSNAGKICTIQVNANQSYQKIDGFGVNINSKHWSDQLIPTMDLLREDLGATQYRVDIWGKSDWIDPSGLLGRAKALSPENLKAVYSGPIFQKGWAMMRYLNQHGIEPYLTASGDVPKWMLGKAHSADHLHGTGLPIENFLGCGYSLVDYEAFCEMLASMVDWARNQEGLKFKLFGPLNESDIAQPEGPGVIPTEFVKVCELLVDKLDQRGLSDIRLVYAEQAIFGPWYLQELLKSPKLQGRIGVFGLHQYSNISQEMFRAVTDLIHGSPFAGVPFWMTEFGDLEQSGECEWYVGWVAVSRLFEQLQAGFSGALVWDAYDNYHDHNEHWTIYGVLRTGLYQYTPKKRYYALKQVFRFVPAGFERIEVTGNSDDLCVLGFANPERTGLTLVGMNLSGKVYYPNTLLNGFPESLSKGKMAYFRTSEDENCVFLGQVPLGNRSFEQIGVRIPPDCIFTLTTVK